MANITITVPDALVPRLIAAMRALYPQYAGLTDAACFKKVTADFWRNNLSGYELGVSADNNNQAIQTQALQIQNDSNGIG